jgi:AAA15 family ATPase/GTPase
MIKYLKVKNFLSFKDETEINFESSLKWKKDDNVIRMKNDDVLMKTSLIYGANASGKSNILKAFSIIKRNVLRKWVIPQIQPFLFDKKTQKQPSYFELCYFMDGDEFTYIIERTSDIVFSEKLQKNTKILFEREKQEIISSDKEFTKEIEKGISKMSEDYSLMSVLHERNAELNNKKIWYFFQKNNILIDDFISQSKTINSFNLLAKNNDKNKKDIVIKFLQLADISIEDLRVFEESFPIEFLETVKDEERRKELESEKYIRIEIGRKVWYKKSLERLSLQSESIGTQKLFRLLWYIIDTIINEKILIIDEIENNLHIMILYKLFDLFHSDMNKKYQFIFTTHNTELMNLRMFKSEQIGIVNKKEDYSTEFYTIYDFEDKKVRTENNVNKMYKLWIFGGIPNVQDFTTLVSSIKSL